VLDARDGVNAFENLVRIIESMRRWCWGIAVLDGRAVIDPDCGAGVDHMLDCSASEDEGKPGGQNKIDAAGFAGEVEDDYL